MERFLVLECGCQVWVGVWDWNVNPVAIGRWVCPAHGKQRITGKGKTEHPWKADERDPRRPERDPR